MTRCDGRDHADCVEIVRTPAGSLAWHVTCYALVKSLLSDDRVGLAHPVPSLAARFHSSPMIGPLNLTPSDERDQHATMRAAMKSFSAARSATRLRPRIQEIAVAHVENLAQQPPPADFHRHVSLTFPVAVACEVLGLRQDIDFLTANIWRADKAVDWQSGKDATDALHAFMRSELESRRRHPRGDLLTDLVQRYQGSMHEAEPLENVATTILIAGSVAPTLLIDHGLILLLLNPAARRLLADDETAIRVLQEILRFGVFAPSHARGEASGINRYANTSFQVADVMVLEGDLLLLNNHEANFDETIYSDPLKFDGARSEASHLSFGFGKRRCPGSNIAYNEMLTLFRYLFDRMPAIHLAATEDEILHDAALSGGRIEYLPVEWRDGTLSQTEVEEGRLRD